MSMRAAALLLCALAGTGGQAAPPPDDHWTPDSMARGAPQAAL